MNRTCRVGWWDRLAEHGRERVVVDGEPSVRECRPPERFIDRVCVAIQENGLRKRMSRLDAPIRISYSPALIAQSPALIA